MKVELGKAEKMMIHLRNCFMAGYTLPQYCIDNGIKKPLFVSVKEHLIFMWDVHLQFRYDKRMLARFSMLDLPTDEVSFNVKNTLGPLKFKKFSEVNPADYDAIILLTTEEIKLTDKVISFIDLTRYFIRKTYAEIPALNFLKRYPGVKLFYAMLPIKMKRYKGGKKFTRRLDKYKGYADRIKASNGEHVPTPFDKFGYTNEEVLLIRGVGGKITTNLDGTTNMTDNDHPLVQITGGKRKTAFQPEHFQNKIYFIGPCHFVGAWAPYDKTIESYLQKLLNENNLPYRVENESQRFAQRYQDMFYKLNSLDPKPGDIVILFISGNLHSENLPVFDVSDAFDPPLDYKKFFWTKGHFNELGYKRLAERFFELLTENNFFRDVEFNYHMPPPPITDTVYLRNSKEAAQKFSSMKSWRLTRKLYAKRKFKSARLS